MSEEKSYFTIQVLVKAFQVVDIMAREARWEFAALARESGLPKGTLQRILLTLAELGYVSREKGGQYALTLKYYKLGQRIASNNPMLDHARPSCRQLMQDVNETVNVCVPLNTDMVVIDQQVSWQTLRLDSVIGSSFPVFQSASGKAFCAFLPQITLFAQQNFFDLDLAMIPDDQHLWGVSGAWDLFSGFQNLSNYKAAKIERGRSEIERERTFLSVMVRVIAADNAVRDAAQAAEVARIAHSAAASRADDLAARAQEGLESLDKALDAEAERDLAQVDLVRSSYAERVARANLALAMGVFDTETARTSANLDH